ncbi:MAG: Na+/H+ antiporter NhaA, partial [Myxococcota bacterium]
FWPYLLVPGALSWFGLYSAHLHPALALCAVVPFMPAMSHDEGMYADEGHHDDTLNRFQHSFKAPVDMGLFAFGLANAGVTLGSVGAATTAVLTALLIGKTVGITGFGLLGRALGFPLPEGMDLRSLVVVGLCASVGLTVALFVSNVAFTDPALQGAAKMGALLSVVAGPLAIAVARALKVKEQAAPPPVADHVPLTVSQAPTSVAP